MKYKFYLLLFFIVCTNAANTQPPKVSTVIVSGTVYDITAHTPIEAVAVLSTSNNGTLTDSMGRYSIKVRSTDSIWFSLISKTTLKFPVDTIPNINQFDVKIYVNATALPEVKVRNKNYRLDSIQNRKDYAKVFDFRKPGIRLLSNPNYLPGTVSVGLDLNEIINFFRFKRNKSIAKLQARLIQQEQDRYIDHRYSKQFVRKLTKLSSPELDSFMNKYRPDYEFLPLLNDIELGAFIQQCYKEYKTTKALPNKGLLRKREE